MYIFQPLYMCIVHYFLNDCLLLIVILGYMPRRLLPAEKKGKNSVSKHYCFVSLFLSTSSSSLSLFLSLLLLLLSLFLSPLLNSWYHHYWWALHSGRGQSWMHVHFIVQVILNFAYFRILSLSLLLIVYQCTSWVITLFAPRRFTVSSLQESQWDMGHTHY